MKQHEVEKQMKQRVCFEMQSCQKQSHVICCTDCKVRLKFFPKILIIKIKTCGLSKPVKEEGNPEKLTISRSLHVHVSVFRKLISLQSIKTFGWSH